jgi:hypothetical protein
MEGTLINQTGPFSDTAAGKLLVEWRAPNPCGSNGVKQLAIYCEDNWIVNAFYDSDGDPALEKGGRC